MATRKGAALFSVGKVNSQSTQVPDITNECVKNYPKYMVIVLIHLIYRIFSFSGPIPRESLRLT
jgi:hypothetical protein